MFKKKLFISDLHDKNILAKKFPGAKAIAEFGRELRHFYNTYQLLYRLVETEVERDLLQDTALRFNESIMGFVSTDDEFDREEYLFDARTIKNIFSEPIFSCYLGKNMFKVNRVAASVVPSPPSLSRCSDSIGAPVKFFASQFSKDVTGARHANRT